jgi:hypothetical protein
VWRYYSKVNNHVTPYVVVFTPHVSRAYLPPTICNLHIGKLSLPLVTPSPCLLCKLNTTSAMHMCNHPCPSSNHDNILLVDCSCQQRALVRRGGGNLRGNPATCVQHLILSDLHPTSAHPNFVPSGPSPTV